MLEGLARWSTEQPTLDSLHPRVIRCVERTRPAHRGGVEFALTPIVLVVDRDWLRTNA